LAQTNSGVTNAAPAGVAGEAAIVSDADIIVTAQRREQRLQDVPVSVAAISGQRIAQSGAVQVRDIFEKIPSVRSQNPTNNGGAPIFNIRGVTLYDFSYTNEPGVAVYTDDIYQGNPLALSQQMFDLERVEVLRGPQGTLFGRNATGGLIQFVSRRPSQTPEFSGSLQYGTYNDITVEGAASGPLTDTLRIRMAGRYQTNDGFQKNLFNGNRLGTIDHAVGLRGSIEWDATPDIRMTAGSHYTDMHGQEDVRLVIGKRDPTDRTIVCSVADSFANRCVSALGFRDPNPKPTTAYSELNDIPYDTKAYGGYLKVAAQLGFAELNLISGYEWGRKYDTSDSDGSPNPSLWAQFFIRHRQFSQEARLLGTNGAVKWQGGIFYYGDHRFTTSQLTYPRIGNVGVQEINSLGVYGQADVSVTETLTVTGGIRHTNDKKDLSSFALVSNPVLGTTAGTPVFTFADVFKTNKTTWRLGADWHVTPDIMLFASVATGFKTGAYNTQIVTTVAAVGPVENETILTYEAGIKSSLLDGVVTANLTAFYSKYKNIQASASVRLTATTSTTQFINIGDANIKGLEAEVTVRPSRELVATGSMSLNRNRLSSPPTVLIAGRTLDGNRLANTPKLSMMGSLDWSPDVAGLRLNFGGDVVYYSKVFFRPDNNPLAIQRSYTLFNARAGWAVTDNFKLEFIARNAFNKRYYTHATDLGDFAAPNWGMPRTLFIKASVKY
jgi:iron complex outermembrane receptor protein